MMEIEPVINASKEDIIACQFDKWFHSFQKDSIKSIIIDLQENFITYLLQDGVILPSSESSAFGYDELSDDEDLIEQEKDFKIDRVDFSQLTTEIKKAIKQLNGEVFVKFNWSAPSDASWLRGGSLKCVDSADIYLLLKSSDRIVFDIENMFNLCPNCDIKRPSQFSLIIRKWANLDPAMEFRVFIGNNQILGISQRDCSTYYDHLSNDKDELEDKIVEFFENKIKGKFDLEKYSTDIFIDRKKRIWIIDFNPFGDPSSGLLFEWHELKTSYESIIPIYETNNIPLININNINNTDNDYVKNENYEIDFEFRTILNKNETFASPSGSSRGTYRSIYTCICLYV